MKNIFNKVGVLQVSKAFNLSGYCACLWGELPSFAEKSRIDRSLVACSCLYGSGGVELWGLLKTVSELTDVLEGIFNGLVIETPELVS